MRVGNRAPSTSGEIIIAVFTGLMFLTYVTSNYFLWKQSRTTQQAADAATKASNIAEKTLKASEQSFKQQERAYVWASSFNISNPPLCQVPGQIRVCADVHILNSGRTPAIGVHIFRSATFGSDAERTVEAMKVPAYPRPSGDMLGSPPGEKWGTAYTTPVNKSTADKLISGELPLYVYGVVQYFDIFGEYHDTGFCSFKLPDNGPFISCPYGNWFDKIPAGR